MSHHDHFSHNLDQSAHQHHNMGSDETGHSLHDMGTSTAMPMSHGHAAGHSSSMPMMAMWFHFGYVETVLFKGWAFTSIGGLIGSMVGIFFMAALYEGLKYYREYLFWKTYNALQYRAVSLPADKAAEDNQIVQPTMLSPMHFYQTFLHIVQMIVSYFLMLIFMTYNVWLCLAVVMGAATGYFLFGWKKSVIVDVTEHCH